MELAPPSEAQMTTKFENRHGLDIPSAVLCHIYRFSTCACLGLLDASVGVHSTRCTQAHRRACIGDVDLSG